MEYDTFSATQYNTSDPTSFAHTSARERWPIIITQGIDDVHRSTHSAQDEETQSEGKWIVSELAKLKYELQHDRELTPIPDDGEKDVEAYNKELAARGSPKWHSVPWLYSECYLYRRISSIFKRTKKWRSYDLFARQKMSTFKSSRPAVVELAARYRDIVIELESKHTIKGAETEEQLEAAEQVLFTEMCEICLWGNATDLSLLTNLSYEDIQKLQGSQARKNSEKNILVNDLSKAFKVLRAAQKEGKKERRVDIVLDNAGFELFVDLILAGYLVASGLATTVVLHPKSIPWFVSDVLPADFIALLSALAAPQNFYGTQSEEDKNAGKEAVPLSETEDSNLQFLFQNWSQMHAEGQLMLRPNDFWTAGGSYWRLPKAEPELLEDLKESELVIFKGDLNYRKLTADAEWAPTTRFTDAIGPMGPGSGVRVLALRTCKADVVVGLSEGEDERIREITGGEKTGARKWAWSGKYAVVQFSDGKSTQ
ncbi:sugar phosphate phosphatase [Parastagonospora nodorum]|nr:sugar phosphate phosphatase [Parastagonospora nodorum]KAH3958282.1 sugar phosphate phosphatase [Parastagonospora nodorum]KAH3992107.1 sugar phosphate phosphatase [Parastagonospora nodorum]KAH4009637.1 sugar phosphate phosphatase [Parastagonospora nodorum]KAH4043520.1 sugar phosphate phosphatase [Parastagonospora nodorum]